jgi:hypothetical protein
MSLAERPRREDRDRDQRLVAGRSQRGELGERELGDVPLAVVREAEEDLLHLEAQAGEVDALDGDRAAHEVADVVVVVDREREMNVRSRARGHAAGA